MSDVVSESPIMQETLLAPENRERLLEAWDKVPHGQSPTGSDCDAVAKRHRQGQTHYITDSDDEICPPFHWKPRGPCNCYKAILADALPVALRRIDELTKENAGMVLKLAWWQTKEQRDKEAASEQIPQGLMETRLD